MKTHRFARYRTPLFIGLCLTAVALGTLPAIRQVRAESPSPAKQDAVAALEQDVKSNPNNSELWLHLGFAYRKVGQVDSAQSAFQKAASLDPRNREAFYMLGLIYEKKNMTSDAQRAWTQYMQTETDPAKRAEAERHLHHLAQ